LGLSADKVMLHFNVLGAIVEFRIVHHSNSALVVSMKWSWAGWTEVEVTWYIPKPDIVAACIASSIVFRFRCRLGNRFLKTRFPSYRCLFQEIHYASCGATSVGTAGKVGVGVSCQKIGGIAAREAQAVVDRAKKVRENAF
jgi:hypothetical protein